MAPRRGGSSGGGGSGSGGGISCSACDSPMSTLFFHLYSDANMYGQLVVNAIFAAALIAVSLLNRRPAAKLTHLATFCFFAACVFQCVRWGLSLPDDWVPHGYRYESSVVVLLQRLGWPVLLTALLRAMRPGKILAAGPWLGVLVLGVLNLAYVVYDFILTDAAVKEWELGEVQGPWRLGDRDFALLWTNSMVGRFTDQPGYTPRPLTWSRDWATRFRAERLYLPADSSVFRNRDTQIKIGIAADVVALLLVLAIGGLHVVTWHRQGKAELPRRRSLLAVAVGGLLLSALFRVVVSAGWFLPNWRIITSARLWGEWLAYFPVTDRTNDFVAMPPYWLPGYRTTVEGFPVVQVVLEQIGPVAACACIVLSMAAERRSRRVVRQQQVPGMKMQGQYS